MDQEKMQALWEACQKWVEENRVRAPESIYQVDSVAVALFDLGEIVCDHVGFYQDGIDETP